MKLSPNHLKRYQEIVNRIITGIILAALILGACQLMLGDPGLAIVCFLAAATGGFRPVISIFVQDHQSRNQSFS